MRMLRFFLCLLAAGYSSVTHLSAFEHGKLLVRSNVAGAEVYLDGTYLDRTGSSRRLLIEQLPPGTYRVRICKEGFKEFRTVVKIADEKTVVVTAHLLAEKTAAATTKQKPDKSSLLMSPAVKLRKDRSAKAHKTVNVPSAVETGAAAPPSSSPSQPTPSTTPSTAASGRVAPQAPKADAKPGLSNNHWVWSLAPALGLGFGAWWLYRAMGNGPSGASTTSSDESRRGAQDADSIELRPEANESSASSLAKKVTQPTEASEHRSPPRGFIRDLRRKEELLEAGLISEPTRGQGPRTNNRSPDTILEVAKEEYHYEENPER